MTSNSNIFTGIIFSLLLHALAFTHWESDFSFNNSINSSENISKHVIIQLVNTVSPITKNIKSIPVKEKPTPPREALITKNKPVEQFATITETKKEIPAKPLDRETAKAATTSPSPSPDEEIKHQQNIELKKIREKEAYIQLLLAHIEAYKFYPGAARRRAIEGKLDITFLLSETGGHYQLKINGGRAILQHAVRQALDDAQPFPKPPSSLTSNQPIAFSMYYKLSDIN